MATIADVPDRSLQQRRDALAVGNAIRSKRAVLKRDLKAGRVELAPLLLDPPEWLVSAKVINLVLACPALGRIKVNACFYRERIGRTKTVAGLTDRQRAGLVAFLEASRGLGIPGPGARGTIGPEQQAKALVLANKARLTRSGAKEKIASGEVSVVDVLTDWDESLDLMPLYDLLAAQHGWGPSRTHRMLVHLNVPESKLIGTLTERQVKLIADKLQAGWA